MNYAYKTKDTQWRRRVWNLMRERVKVPPRDAVVVYLAGPDNLDLPIALSKGFRRENLIAVEHDPAIAQSLRASGQLTVEGDLLSVLSCWSDSTPIHGVIADFCCDIKATILDRAAGLLVPDAFRSCVFALNFQRGRDKSLNEFRRELGPRIKECTGNPKHRGALFWAGAIEHMVRGAVLCAHVSEICAPAAFLHAATLLLATQSRPQFTEYYSQQGRSYFDGVLFDNPMETKGEPRPGGTNRELFPDADPAIRRSVSAVLAHRTRRLAAA